MSKTFPVTAIINGIPCFSEPLDSILSHLSEGGAISVMTPLEHHTARQRRWYRGICLKGLSEWNGDTVDEWDLRLKDKCNGVELLKKMPITLTLYGQDIVASRLSIVGVGKRKMTAYIENILSKAIEMGWPVQPPDSDLRKL